CPPPGLEKDPPPPSPPPVDPPHPPPPDEPQPIFPSVYVERALVNPAGDDVSREVVVIGNTTTAPVDLSGWSIVDKNNAADALARVLLPAGGSVLIALTRDGAA